MWSLSKILNNVEVQRVYITSFVNVDPKNKLKDIIDKEKNQIFKEIKRVPRNSPMKKFNRIIRRAKSVMINGLIVSEISKLYNKAYFKNSAKNKIIKDLPEIFKKIQQEHQFELNEFPDIEMYREKLSTLDFKKLKKYNEKLFNNIMQVFESDIQEIMNGFLPKYRRNVLWNFVMGLFKFLKILAIWSLILFTIYYIYVNINMKAIAKECLDKMLKLIRKTIHRYKKQKRTKKSKSYFKRASSEITKSL